MKVCPRCGRSYNSAFARCRLDGEILGSAGTAVEMLPRRYQATAGALLVLILLLAPMAVSVAIFTSKDTEARRPVPEAHDDTSSCDR